MTQELFWDIGGCRVRLTAPEGVLNITGPLTQFQTEPGPWALWLEIVPVPSLPIPESTPVFASSERRVYWEGGAVITLLGSRESPYLRMERSAGYSRVLARQAAFPYGIGSKAVLRAMEAEHLLAGRDGVLLHCSYICRENRAILFTAPSGVGKSTQAALWQQHRGAQILNGDRAAVRLENGQFYAYGIPFSGSSGICHRAKHPIAAIVALSQAPQTGITPLTGRQAFRVLWEGCSVPVWQPETVEKQSQTVAKLAQLVPVYHLACTPDETAVLALEAHLQEDVL